MQKIEEEYKQLDQSAHRYEENYQTFQMPKKFNFPTICLTRDEIIEFNEECKRSGIGLKVVPLSDYLNLNKPQGIHTDPDSVIEVLGNSAINLKEEVKEEEPKSKEDSKSESSIKIIEELQNNSNNQFLNKKKRRTTIDDKSKESSKSSEEINYSLYSENSSFSIEINKKGLKWDEIKNDMKNKKMDKRKNNSKKSKKPKMKNSSKKDINIDFSNIFKKIKETCDYNKNEENRFEEVIREIEDKSKNLTENGLIQMANQRKIRHIGYQFSIDELRKKNLNYLENLLVDINQNSECFDKLDQNRNPTIRAKEKKEEFIRISKERKEKRKIEKEEKRKNMSQNNIIKKNRDSSDEEDSESSIDENF